ncbi:hypothetical protein [Paenibacillus sp. FSL H7-0326]|uniref:hypothetical protein n=1 Tax=Paenibacillus sp. FSL H7-0326 TaxID=1921144 RepID=UPI0015C3A0C0|nr:hypothetical protein [Paenibacillus sp. FSL H7-0326]
MESTNHIRKDGQERNLLPAREMGWETILADSKGQWIKTVNELLKLSQESSAF